MKRTYETGTAFKTALNQRIRKRAQETGRPQMELQREFFMQRFLARVFADPATPWVVTGGGGLLVRIPGARHSRDIDLLHRDADLDKAVSELRQLGTSSDLDPLIFDIGVKSRHLHGITEGMSLSTTPYIGAAKLSQPVPIDLAVRRELVGEVDYITPTPVIEIDDISPLPKFAVFPLADQIADKVAAMYELHGQDQTTPSTRWRDLADLLLLTGRFPLDAAKINAAFNLQCQRRKMPLPTAIHSPGPQWIAGYRALAVTTALPVELQTLDAALESLGQCLNPLLEGRVTAGNWNPNTRVWESTA